MEFGVNSLSIRYLFGYKNVDMELDDVTVLVGINGSGKSTILRIIHSLMTLSESENLKLCEYATLTLGDSFRIVYENFHRDDSKDIVKKIFLETINSRSINLDRMESEDILRLMTTKLDNLKKHKKENKFKIYRNGLRINQDSFKRNYLERINIEFISNVDLSANSRLNFTTSSGEDANVLDNSIDKELVKIFEDKRSEKRSALRNSMNRFLKESGKRVRRSTSGMTIVCPHSGPLTYNHLSSGERQLLYIMLKAVNSMDYNSVILMDEPEISLHLSWQEMLIDVLREINPDSQLIIVTHSPGILMNGYRDAFRDMKDIERVIIDDKF
ncbi:AAA family ATPase [Pantoea stewartii]|uniref:AAA+ ATPase domain-containing protein n=1 Tax=Pantoea stewartii TaxID=66269 RepID=A0AB34VFS4_9GAMM|nr:ATP-binding protein [Pantoea stewartii]KTS72198.1 hypothetical protein RSA30_15330 [Pantoea stewartii]KTS97626.1 hypothetical protein RSA13_11030 [Pantoea stewartii]KTT04936.1 hypothetical protein RSA36_21850 [Pantoea stewartii]